MAALPGRFRPGLRGKITRVVVAGVVALVLGACGGEVRDDHGGAAGGLSHIHGLGINPADGALYVGSHHGVFRVTGQGAPEQVSRLIQDFMGFTVGGPNHFLGSGHPAPDDAQQPAHLGLIESTDSGRTWRSVSLSGEVDFHAMEAKHGQVYGYDSQSSQVMVSTNRTTWERRATLTAADIAVSPVEPGTVLATTEQGPARSLDGGRSFTPIAGAPLLYFLDWASAQRLVGVAPDGMVFVSADGGATWGRQGQVAGQPQAITTHGETGIYVATDQAIYRSEDNGKTFQLFQALT